MNRSKKLLESLAGRIVLGIDDYFYDHPKDFEILKSYILYKSSEEEAGRIAKRISKVSGMPVSLDVLVTYAKDRDRKVHVGT